MRYACGHIGTRPTASSRLSGSGADGCRRGTVVAIDLAQVDRSYVVLLREFCVDPLTGSMR